MKLKSLLILALALLSSATMSCSTLNHGFGAGGGSAYGADPVNDDSLYRSQDKRFRSQ